MTSAYTPPLGRAPLPAPRRQPRFAPNGFTGIHQGAALVFFAYIGFDAISTAAEETSNPSRNLPISSPFLSTISCSS